ASTTTSTRVRLRGAATGCAPPWSWLSVMAGLPRLSGLTTAGATAMFRRRSAGAGAEEGRADPHAGGAEAHGGLVVGAHPHRQPLKAVARGDGGEQGEVGAGGLGLGRDAHQPLDLQAVGLATGGDE